MVSQMWPQEETEERLRKNQILFYSQALQTGGLACHTGPQREAPGWSEVRRQEGGEAKATQFFLEFPWERQAGLGEQIGTG